MAEPQVVVTLTGKIVDFTRLDNLYNVMKRETKKLLKDWEFTIKVEYGETEKGEG